jgi:hypothetical protein
MIQLYFQHLANTRTPVQDLSFISFPGGERHVRLPVAMQGIPSGLNWVIEARMESPADVMDLLLLNDALRRARPGEPIALVAAETLEIAEQALGLIDLQLEPTPGVFCPEEALRPEAPKMFGDDGDSPGTAGTAWPVGPVRVHGCHSGLRWPRPRTAAGVGRSHFRKWPCPALPRYWPSRQTTLPRLSVSLGQALSALPS